MCEDMFRECELILGQLVRAVSSLTAVFMLCWMIEGAVSPFRPQFMFTLPLKNMVCLGTVCRINEHPQSVGW